MTGLLPPALDLKLYMMKEIHPEDVDAILSFLVDARLSDSPTVVSRNIVLCIHDIVH